MTRHAYFIDTGIWKAFFDPNDRWHQITSSILREISESRPHLYTSDVVILEFITEGRKGGLSIQKIDNFVESILKSSKVHFLTQEDLTTARQTLLRYSNLQFSGVDATIIAIADRLEIKMILTTDGDFMKCNKFNDVRPNLWERRAVLEP